LSRVDTDLVSTSDRRPTSASERIRREARVVGLRDFRSPSLEAVERRRMQLWIITTILLVLISGGIAVLAWMPVSSLPELITPRALRLGIVFAATGFCAYAIEKELHLRRLSRLLIDERVLTSAFSNRLHEVSLLLDAGKAMNSVLELETVLEVILRGAVDLLQARSGSIMLLEGDELVSASVIGNDEALESRVTVGEGIAGKVAVWRDAHLINGVPRVEEFPGLQPKAQEVRSAMSAPLIHREELLGVLNVNADIDREFNEYDLRALSLFAEQASSAITNARLYEAERSHVAELLELDLLKTEFVTRVSHELRTPLTSILAAAQTAQRPERLAEHPEVVGIIERQARQLSTMVEELLTASKLDQDGRPTAPQEVDLAGLTRSVAMDYYEGAGRRMAVEVPEEPVEVLADADSMRHVLVNLIDNAMKYGAPPITVRVERGVAQAVLSVIDRGAGVPPDERDRVFDQFHRVRRIDSQPGLGLGLPIVRGLVAAFGGRVWIEDAPGGGAAFRVALPLLHVQSEPAAV
jgi:signal transduction histidine kinase